MANRFGVAVMAAFMLAGCGEPTAPVSPAEELAAARQRWVSSGPASYDLTLDLHLLEGGTVRPIVVAVRDGLIRSKTYFDTGEAFVGHWVTDSLDVPGLFALISEEMADSRKRVTAQYDAVTGFPHRLDVAFKPPAADGVYWVMAGLRSATIAK